MIQNSNLDNEEKMLKIASIIKSNMFPINYGSYNNDSFYYDKYMYPLSVSLGCNYRYYPYYIKYELDNNIIDNQKRKFRLSCNNYELNNDYILCLKQIIKIKIESKTDIKKFINTYELRKKLKFITKVSIKI